MKAVRIHSFGGPEVLVYEDAPRPKPAAGEVLVKVHASSLNPVDGAMRAGHLQGMLQLQLPMTPGFDLAGVIEALGEGVNGFTIGDAVYGFSNMLRQGAYAEYAVLSASELARKPAGISFGEAASLPLAGLTAWQGLFTHGGLQAGQTVLIHGAGGGVGSLAVQLALAKGARVLATASSGKIALLHELGVHQAIDYTTSKFEHVARNVDLVFDAVGAEIERSFAVLKKGGKYVSPAVQPDPALATKYGVSANFMLVQANQNDLNQLSSLVEAGKLQPIVSEIVPLAEIIRAHELLERGHLRGKIAIQVIA